MAQDQVIEGPLTSRDEASGEGQIVKPHPKTHAEKGSNSAGSDLGIKPDFIIGVTAALDTGQFRSGLEGLVQENIPFEVFFRLGLFGYGQRGVPFEERMRAIVFERASSEYDGRLPRSFSKAFETVFGRVFPKESLGLDDKDSNKSPETIEGVVQRLKSLDDPLSQAAGYDLEIHLLEIAIEDQQQEITEIRSTLANPGINQGDPSLIRKLSNQLVKHQMNHRLTTERLNSAKEQRAKLVDANGQAIPDQIEAIAKRVGEAFGTNFANSAGANPLEFIIQRIGSTIFNEGNPEEGLVFFDQQKVLQLNQPALSKFKEKIERAGFMAPGEFGLIENQLSELVEHLNTLSDEVIKQTNREENIRKIKIGSLVGLVVLYILISSLFSFLGEKNR